MVKFLSWMGTRGECCLQWEAAGFLGKLSEAQGIDCPSWLVRGSD
jgi:hypothetical protein